MMLSPRTYISPPPVPKMPPGLVQLMEGLTRDVLKNNPTDVYTFCANHMEKLLELRDGKPLKKLPTLDEKIKIAQQKVRERAIQRQERIDNMLKNATDISSAKEENADLTAIENNEKDLSLLKAPIHHDFQSSEVEISHETLNKIEYKITNTENSIKIEISEPVDSVTDVDEPHQCDEPHLGDETNHLRVESFGTGVEIRDKMTSIPEYESETNLSDDKLIVENNNLVEENVDAKNDLPLDPVKEKDFTPDALEEVSNVIKEEIGDNQEMEMKEDSFEPGISSKEIIENLDTTEIIKEDKIDEKGTDPPIYVEKRNENNIIAETNVSADIDCSKIEDSFDDKVSLSDSIVDSTNPIDNSPKERSIETEDQIEYETKDQNEQNNEIKAEPEKDIELTENIDFGNNISTPELKTEVMQVDEKVAEVVEQNDEYSDVKAIDQEKSADSTLAVSNTDDENKIPENANELNNEIKVEAEVNVSKQDINKDEDSSDTNKNTEQDNTDTVSINKSESIENFNDDNSSIIESDFSKTEEDVSRIDNEHSPNNMDLETAAVTIQKVFRTFLFKSRNSTFDDSNIDESASLDEDSDKKEEYYAAVNLPKERRTLGITRMDTVLQTVNEEKSLSLSTDDSSTLSSAATTIQAHVRGFLIRNRLNSNKTVSSSSLPNSNEALEPETEHKNKTILNIHIVPEESNYLSRDESLITSMDLSLDACSPPSSVTLHPMSFDIAERRKLLKREDAVQSVSPPSNNSGKLSEESVKDVFVNDSTVVDDLKDDVNDKDQCSDSGMESEVLSTDSTVTAATVIKNDLADTLSDTEDINKQKSPVVCSDESDVVTPFAASPRSAVSVDSESSRLMHSSEFHDVVLPTKVTRSDTTIVSGE